MKNQEPVEKNKWVAFYARLQSILIKSGKLKDGIKR